MSAGNPIRFDGPAGKRAAGKPAAPGGTKPVGTTASQNGAAGKPSDEDAETNRKGAVKTEAVEKTGPVIIEGGNERGTEFEQPKRRGRPRGSTNSNSRKRSQQETVSVEGFTFMLASAHTMLAALTKNPAWEIADVEAKEMATAIAKVQEQYPFTVDPKAQAWINLVMVAGMIYVPRVVSTRAAKHPRTENAQPEKGPAEKPAPQNVDPQKAQAKKQGGPVTPSQLYGTIAGRG